MSCLMVTIMTDLSPAAQAVLDAAIKAAESPDAEAIAAAALRAAAYVAAPAVPSLDFCCDRRSAQIRHQLLNIAVELEGADAG
jgi:hypothetical protein